MGGGVGAQKETEGAEEERGENAADEPPHAEKPAEEGVEWHTVEHPRRNLGVADAGEPIK